MAKIVPVAIATIIRVIPSCFYHPLRQYNLESEVNRNLMNSRLASLLRRRLSADADGEHELRLECPELQ